MLVWTRLRMLSIASLLTGCLLDFDPSRLARPETCSASIECLPGIGCCESSTVPAGRFDRGYDVSDRATEPSSGDAVVTGWQARGAAPATVSTFDLDRFEVTVGRMRAFAAAYDAWRAAGHPRVGDGAHPVLGAISGWQPSWNALLPASAALLESELACSSEGTWDLGDDRLPANCVSFYVAFAFCAWDGGRLPTEAEWNYAAAGGEEQRPFPWGLGPVDASHAIFGGSRPATVGSRAMDAGRWGHFDLAGNVREWVLDTAPGEESYLVPCADCAELVGSPQRRRRGGDYAADAARLRTAYRSSAPPNEPQSYIGIRCARRAP